MRLNLTESHRRARISAVLSILGFLVLPLVYLSIRIWNTPSHPGPVVGGEKGSGVLDINMRLVFYFSVISFHLLFFSMVSITSQFMTIKEKLDEQNTDIS